MNTAPLFYVLRPRRRRTRPAVVHAATCGYVAASWRAKSPYAGAVSPLTRDDLSDPLLARHSCVNRFLEEASA
jgi:hypothetical protein